MDKTVAERERFELSVPLEYAVLAGLWFKPLTHLSRRAFLVNLAAVNPDPVNLDPVNLGGG